MPEIQIRVPSGSEPNVSYAQALVDGAGRLFVKAYLRGSFYQDTIWIARADGTVDHVVWKSDEDHRGTNGMFVGGDGKGWHLAVNKSGSGLILHEIPEFVPVKVGAAPQPTPSTDPTVVVLQKQVAQLQASLTTLTTQLTARDQRVEQALQNLASKSEVWEIADQEARATVRAWLEASKLYDQPGGTRELFDLIYQRIMRANSAHKVLQAPDGRPMVVPPLPPAEPIP